MPLAVLAIVAGAGGCSDLSEFDTGPDQVYRGRVLGVDSPDMSGGSFIRRGFAEGTVMTLRLDTDRLDSPEAGRITTDGDACGGPAFEDTRLRAITPLQHDSLSLYDFPGNGRIRNLIYAARPSGGPLADRGVTVYVSLIRGGKIQVRVLSGFGGETCGPCECFFGVFELEKEDITP